MKNFIITLINKTNCMACGHCAASKCVGCPVESLLVIKHRL